MMIEPSEKYLLLTDRVILGSTCRRFRESMKSDPLMALICQLMSCNCPIGNKSDERLPWHRIGYLINQRVLSPVIPIENAHHRHLLGLLESELHPNGLNRAFITQTPEFYSILFLAAALSGVVSTTTTNPIFKGVSKDWRNAVSFLTFFGFRGRGNTTPLIQARGNNFMTDSLVAFRSANFASRLADVVATGEKAKFDFWMEEKGGGCGPQPQRGIPNVLAIQSRCISLPPLLFQHVISTLMQKYPKGWTSVSTLILLSRFTDWDLTTLETLLRTQTPDTVVEMALKLGNTFVSAFYQSAKRVKGDAKSGAETKEDKKDKGNEVCGFCESPCHIAGSLSGMTEIVTFFRVNHPALHLITLFLARSSKSQTLFGNVIRYLLSTAGRDTNDSSHCQQRFRFYMACYLGSGLKIPVSDRKFAYFILQRPWMTSFLHETVITTKWKWTGKFLSIEDERKKSLLFAFIESAKGVQ